MNPASAALLSVAVVSLTSMVGVLGLAMTRESTRRFLFVLVSFAVGALFGDVFFHLVPEMAAEDGFASWAPWAVLGGFFAFFGLEKFVRWRHCHLPEEHGHVHPMVATNLVGDGVHNLLDGMIIAAAWQADPSVGFATTLAVFCHEVPQEFGDFGVLMQGGLSAKKALLWNLGSASLAFLGAGISLWLGSSIESYTAILTGVTAGGFLYIAGSDLVPELQHEVRARVSALQALCIAAGILLMAGLAHLEH